MDPRHSTPVTHVASDGTWNLLHSQVLHCRSGCSYFLFVERPALVTRVYDQTVWSRRRYFERLIGVQLVCDHNPCPFLRAGGKPQEEFPDLVVIEHDSALSFRRATSPGTTLNITASWLSSAGPNSLVSAQGTRAIFLIIRWWYSSRPPSAVSRAMMTPRLWVAPSLIATSVDPYRRARAAANGSAAAAPLRTCRNVRRGLHRARRLRPGSPPLGQSTCL